MNATPPGSAPPGSVTTDSPTPGPGPGIATPPGSATNESPRPASPPPPAAASSGRRPLVERLGLGLIALVVAVLFGAMAAAAFAGGEVFLAAMSALGALMTAWAGALTLVRGK